MVELADERRAASEAIRNLRMSPVLFEIGARPHPPRQLYTAYLQQSDVFIGIYGQKYGWVDAHMSISGIEDEYDLASDKPRLVYIKATSERDQRLNDLLDRITAEGAISYKRFSSADELCELIENDLAVLLSERFQSAVVGHDFSVTGVDYGASHWQPPPRSLTALIGQKRLLSTASRLLKRGSVRLVVLTGPGGVGKTRLATEIAHRVSAHFVDGVAWVDLGSIGEEELVLPAVAQSIRLPRMRRESISEVETDCEPILQSLADRLASSRALIVLDNFEHVLGSAPHLPELLQRCPNLAMLVTSRESLRARGEYEILVNPLTMAELGADTTRELVLKTEAAQLLLECTRAAAPGFEITEGNAPAIATLCSRVDGLPLGLELTASHLKYMSPQDLADKVMTDTVPPPVYADRPARHQSLRATLDWSYQLLTESQKSLFARLSVFGDGFSLDAVPSVCGWDRARVDSLGDMYSLVDKSLVRSLSGPDSKVRFGMFLTIRDYASQRLAASGEAEMARERHARYYCDLAETAETLTSDRLAWLQLLDAETANLRIALGWALDGGDLNIGLRLAGSLGWFWNIAGRLVEGARWIATLLARPWDDCGAEERARALYCAAWIAWRSEQYGEAREYVEQALSLRRTLNDNRRLALALSCQGLVATSERDYELALSAHREAYSILDGLADEWGLAYALSNLGDVYLETGQLAEAENCYVDGLERFSHTGDPWGQAIVLQTLGNLAWRRRDVAGAREYYRQAVANWRRMGMHGNAGSITGLAAATLAEGDAAEARDLLLQGMKIWRNLGSQTGMSICLEGLAAVLSYEGCFHEALVLSASAQAHRTGRPFPYAVEAGLFDDFIRHARENLGEGLLADAQREGRLMSIEEALVRAGECPVEAQTDGERLLKEMG